MVPWDGPVGAFLSTALDLHGSKGVLNVLVLQYYLSCVFLGLIEEDREDSVQCFSD